MTKLALVHIPKICSHWVMPPINIKDTLDSDNIHFSHKPFHSGELEAFFMLF